MLLYLNIFLSLVNLLYYKMNRRSKFLEFLSLLFILLVMGSSSRLADYVDYKTYYENSSLNSGFEFGYVMVSSVFHSIGRTFENFRSTLFLVSTILFYFSARKLMKNVHLFLFFYLSYSIIIDSIQFRATLACSIIYVAIFYLIKGKNWLFCTLVLLATSFHLSCAIYFLLLPMNKIEYIYNHYKSTILLCILLISAYTYFWGELPSFISNSIIKYLPSAKQTYFLNRAEASLVFTIFPLYNLFISSTLYNNMNRVYFDHRFSESDMYFAKCVYVMAILGLLLCPFLTLGSDNLRIIRYNTYGIIGIASIYVQKISKSYHNVFLKFSQTKVVGNKSVLVLSLLLFYVMWMVGYQYFRGYHGVFSIT